MGYVSCGKWRWTSLVTVLSEIKKINNNSSMEDLRGSSSLYIPICRTSCPFIFTKEDEKIISSFGKASNNDTRKKLPSPLFGIKMFLMNEAKCENLGVRREDKYGKAGQELNHSILFL